MTSDNAYGKVEYVSCGWYMLESLRSLVLGMVETRRPYGACSSTKSDEVGCVVISNVPVGTASR
jgi:hypothetical protein